jgi:hypothetical protein
MNQFDSERRAERIYHTCAPMVQIRCSELLEKLDWLFRGGIAAKLPASLLAEPSVSRFLQRAVRLDLVGLM